MVTMTAAAGTGSRPKSFLAKRAEVLEHRVSTRSRRLLYHLGLALITSAALMVVAFVGRRNANDACKIDGPVNMSQWLRGMYLLEALSCLLFLWMYFVILTLLRRLARKPQAADEPPTQEAVPSSSTSCCFASGYWCSQVLILVLLPTQLLWCVLGIVAGLRALKEDACQKDLIYVWILVALTPLSGVLCHFGSFLSTQRDDRPKEEVAEQAPEASESAATGDQAAEVRADAADEEVVEV